MTMAESLARGRANVKKFHENTGVKCTVRGLTWNSTKKLWEPPYTNKAIHIPVTISSIDTIRDPDIASFAQSLNISLQEYRLITAPYGMVSVVKDDYVIKEPVTSDSDRYIVVQAMAPDETSAMELVLHCKKLSKNT